MTKNTPDAADKTEFVPTIKEWEALYSKWFRRLVCALWKSGGVEAVEDAVQEAFLKVTGLSGNRELRSGLEPMTETGWFFFVKRQAEWILGQEREKNLKGKTDVSTVDELAQKIVDIRNDSVQSKSSRTLSLRRHRQLMAYLVELEGLEAGCRLPSDRLDADRCAQVVRSLIERVCREGGVSDRNRDAFLLYVLDEMPPSEVVVRVWGEPTSLEEAAERKNGLYVIKNRIIRRLRDFAEKWRGGGRSSEDFLSAA